MYEINSGRKQVPIKTVIYGPEGIGKSTLASKFPNPLYIDTEGSTDHMDVNRLKQPASFTELISMIDWVKSTKPCSTLVIDTIDWAERLATNEVLAEYNHKGMEDFGYGKGYQYLHEKIGKLLDKLTDVINAGINVVLLGHAKIVKFEDPGEMGAYDRYELKLRSVGKTDNSTLVKEWSDMILFLNYKVMSVKTDENGKTYKGQGGQRTMYTTHRPAWDAKNRFGLPDEVPMDYSSIAHIIPDLVGMQQPVQPTVPQETIPQTNTSVEQPPQQETVPFDTKPIYPDYVPNDLAGLMESYNVTLDELQGVIGLFGHFPINTPIQTIATSTPEYLSGALVANWENVMKKITSIRANPDQLIDIYRNAGDPTPEQTVANLTINKL